MTILRSWDRFLTHLLAGFLLNIILAACGEKFPLPPQNVTTNREIVTDTLYVQQTPV